MAEEGSIPRSWAEQARYDLDTARAMLQTGRYLYVLFCCQQAVEKMVKGIIAGRTKEMPPRLHSLPLLAVKAGLTMDEARTEFFGLLSSYYVQSRYPEEIEAMGGWRRIRSPPIRCTKQRSRSNG